MKTIYNKYLGIMLLLFACCQWAGAQNTMADAVNVGSKSTAFTYTNTLNTANYTNNYTGRSTNDVFYKFTLSKPMEVTISHCGSQLSDTYLSLLDASGTRIDFNDNYSGTGHCSNTQQAYLKRTLPSGTYYVVSEGYSSNGGITTTITGIPAPFSTLPYRTLGTLTGSNTLTETYNTAATSAANYYAGLSNNDVIHRFSVSTPLEVSLSHAGSTASATTYLYLLDASGVKLANNSNTAGRASLKKILTAGTYYAVSESVPNGSITLTVTGNNKPEILAGSFSTDFMYVHTQNTTETANFNPVHGANDVRYKLVLSKPMDVIISQCGSQVSDTYVTLQNSSNTVLYDIDSYSGAGQCDNTQHPYLKTNLQAGTYYVISEGKNGANGNITTSIQGILPSTAATGISNNQNYIKTRTYLSSDTTYFMDAVQYFDGLGRPVQQTQVGITPGRKDLVSMQLYDAFGRDSLASLPAVADGNNGAFVSVSNLTNKLGTTYNTTTYNTAADTKPYSKQVYEASPLNRVLEQYGPGNAWQTNSKAVKTEYLSNNTDYPCRQYYVEGSNLKKKASDYDSGSLYVTKITDEDGNISYEFKDKLGQVVLQRQVNGTTSSNDTYYVYDDFGNLRYVLPPAASDTLTSSSTTYSLTTLGIKNYAYYYRYDERKRCVMKQLPGADSISYRYDTADRLILTQDGEMRINKQWAFSIPDVFGRAVLEGIYYANTNNTPPTISGVVKASFAGGNSSNFGYTLSGISFPTGTKDYLRIYYYDNYLFKGLLAAPDTARYKYAAPSGFEDTRYGTDDDLVKAKGLLTGSLVMTLDDFNHLRSVYFYDSKGRMIQSVSENHLGGCEKEYVNYSFTGQPTRKQTVHTSTHISGNIMETYRYYYDHADRPTVTKYKIDNDPEIVLSELVYDELGRVKKKNLLADKSASNSALQSITYSYNIRNRLKGIASSGFTENLFYNDPPSGTGFFNGNISRMNWVSYYGSSQGYQFTYDGLNRMTKAAYGTTDLFNEELTYDKMGNIKTLKRSGSQSSSSLIDNLTLTYNGNQLKTVNEAATGSIYGFTRPGGSYAGLEYSYNKNGAMKYDFNGGIAYIQYNWLNLPDKISFAKGHMTTYTYDASGQKRQVTHITVQNELAVAMGNANYQVNNNNVQSWLKTDYCGNGHIVYEDNALKMVLTPEGYLTKSNNKYFYNFYLRDHLGNNREVLKWSGAMPYAGNWNVVQENEYYPFGMPYPTAGYYPEAQPYKFGGKEMDEMNGLKWYDFEARQKGTVLPPFTTRDPLAEKYYNISPYAYCNNNPVRFVDPDGRDWKDKVMGAVIGIATNVVPLSTGLRNLYSPNDAADYNNTLQAVDNTAMAVGTLMMIDGGIDIAAGQGVATAGAAITVGSGGTGAEVGVPVAGAGEVISGIGVAKVATGAVTLFNGANNASQGYDYGGKNNASSGNSNTSNTSKPSTQTSSGQAADKHGNKLGPSGKPQVNKVTLSSQKQAKDAARSNGDGKPVKHSSPSKGNSHYHPTDKDGQKIPNSTHYEYPK